MKSKILARFKLIGRYSFLFLPVISFSQKQIPKGANTIKISNITFKEVADSLLDQGFFFEKLDSNFKTIKTEFKSGEGKNKWMKLRLSIRIKDSTAIISGEWYNSMFIGSKIFGVEQTIENSTEKIENTIGNPKNCFNEMNKFALSFNKSVEYLILK